MRPQFIILMGVSGSGKTSVGTALAARLGWDFFDGDDFHSPENVAKMANGIPLNDNDRAPWLAALNAKIRECMANQRPGVLACSALKQQYRKRLLAGNPGVQIIYLKGDYDLIAARMMARSHYMKPGMLQSQFDTLEEPADAITIDIEAPVDRIVEKIISILDQTPQIGIVGLGVMGRSLALNLYRNGVGVVGYDPCPKVDECFPITITNSVAELLSCLEIPRLILLMVPAGQAVDEAIAELKPLLRAGDIIVDGGNSHFLDTERRIKELEHAGLLFAGMGVSGGEKGALWGACLMPGGMPAVWEHIRPIFRLMAAKATDHSTCIAWMGNGGAGHYVKMVHNGIEYADMQLIAEIYDLLQRGAGIDNQQLAAVFDAWNQKNLQSFLIEITADILKQKDGASNVSLVDMILDEAAQKGTGKWVSQNALDIGVATPTINAAVESRFLSGVKCERMTASKSMGGTKRFSGKTESLLRNAEQALYLCKIIAYAQGFALLQRAAEEYGFEFDLAEIARIWRGGCIIRAAILDDIAAVFAQNPQLPNLLLDESFQRIACLHQASLRKVVQCASDLGIPIPAMSSALAYFDGYRSERLPANLIQAQRDYFGAHTYRRVDTEEPCHSDWEDLIHGDLLQH